MRAETRRTPTPDRGRGTRGEGALVQAPAGMSAYTLMIQAGGLNTGHNEKLRVETDSLEGLKVKIREKLRLSDDQPMDVLINGAAPALQDIQELPKHPAKAKILVQEPPTVGGAPPPEKEPSADLTQVEPHALAPPSPGSGLEPVSQPPATEQGDEVGGSPQQLRVSLLRYEVVPKSKDTKKEYATFTMDIAAGRQRTYQITRRFRDIVAFNKALKDIDLPHTEGRKVKKWSNKVPTNQIGYGTSDSQLDKRKQALQGYFADFGDWADSLSSNSGWFIERFVIASSPDANSSSGKASAAEKEVRTFFSEAMNTVADPNRLSFSEEDADAATPRVRSDSLQAVPELSTDSQLAAEPSRAPAAVAEEDTAASATRDISGSLEAVLKQSTDSQLAADPPRGSPAVARRSDDAQRESPGAKAPDEIESLRRQHAAELEAMQNAHAKESHDAAEEHRAALLANDEQIRNEHRGQISSLQAELESLRTELSSKSSDANAIGEIERRKDSSAMTATESAVRTEMEELRICKQRLAELSSINAHLDESVAELSSKNAKLWESIAELSLKNTHLDQSMADLASKNGTLEHANEQHRKIFADSIRKNEEQVAGLQDQLRKQAEEHAAALQMEPDAAKVVALLAEKDRIIANRAELLEKHEMTVKKAVEKMQRTQAKNRMLAEEIRVLKTRTHRSVAEADAAVGGAPEQNVPAQQASPVSTPTRMLDPEPEPELYSELTLSPERLGNASGSTSPVNLDEYVCSYCDDFAGSYQHVVNHEKSCPKNQSDSKKVVADPLMYDKLDERERLISGRWVSRVQEGDDYTETFVLFVDYERKLSGIGALDNERFKLTGHCQRRGTEVEVSIIQHFDDTQTTINAKLGTDGTLRGTYKTPDSDGTFEATREAGLIEADMIIDGRNETDDITKITGSLQDALSSRLVAAAAENSTMLDMIASYKTAPNPKVRYADRERKKAIIRIHCRLEFFSASAEDATRFCQLLQKLKEQAAARYFQSTSFVFFWFVNEVRVHSPSIQCILSQTVPNDLQLNRLCAILPRAGRSKYPG